MKNRPPTTPALHLPELGAKHSITKLTPGKVSLSQVPVRGDFLEIETPCYGYGHGMTSIDVLVERDFVEVRRTDKQDFNVCSYSSRGGDIVKNFAFRAPVPSVILSCGNRGNWQMDGFGMEIDSLEAVYSFLSIVGTFARRKQ